MTQTEKVIQALNEFSRASAKLQTIWEDAEAPVNDALCNSDYPFEDDFYQVNRGIDLWTQVAKVKLRNL